METSTTSRATTTNTEGTTPANGTTAKEGKAKRERLSGPAADMEALKKMAKRWRNRGGKAWAGNDKTGAEECGELATRMEALASSLAEAAL